MQNDSEPLYPTATLSLKDSYEPNAVQLSPIASAPPPTILVQAPTVLVGPDNTVTTCPFCHASIKTAVRHTTTSRTHLIALLCTVICCCCCIPYCMESTKNSDHYCPACKRYLGTYKK